HSNLNGILPLIRLVLSEAEPDMYLRGISIADMKAVIEIIHAQVLADLRARSYDVVILENLDDKNGISRETFYNILLNRHSVKPKVQSKSITDKTHVKKVLCDILGESDDTIRAIKESLMFIKRPSPLEKACNNLLLILLRLHEQLYIKGFISPKELSQYTKNVIMILRQNHVLARYAQNFGITELFADNQKVEHEVWDFIEENIDNFKKELDYVIADLLEKTKDKFVWQLISESCAGGTVLLNEGKTVGVFINNKASDKELKHAYIHGLAAAWAWRALASNNIMIEHTDVMVIANLFSRLLSKELISERSYYEEVVQFLDMDDRKGLLLVQYVLEQKKKEYALYRTDDNTIEFIDLYTHQDMLRFIYGSYGQYQSKQFINAQAVHNFYKIYGVVPSPESTLNGTLGRELSHEEIRRLIQSYNEIPNLEIVGQKKIKRTLRKNESTVNGSGFARRNTVDDPMQLQVMYHSA
ncbi:MAG: hypothetical protein JW938_01180, partial [Candidatus Omnitrophica bacterium]|nr:hypothetical protein [Candidatus Omnitrophota bacterium]